MSDNGFIDGLWRTYLFRLVVSSLPVGFIAGITLWIGGQLSLSAFPRFIILLMVLLAYGYTFEEKYIKPWRREPTSVE